MNLKDCYNYEDFRRLAKKNLPAPIFHYIDGGSDDETTLKRNTESFLKCDLVPNILANVGEPDLTTSVFGEKINMPLFLAPTAMQRLYHHDGDKASARAAEKFGTFIACLLWPHPPLRKFPIYLVVRKCFNFISTKIKVSQIT